MLTFLAWPHIQRAVAFVKTFCSQDFKKGADIVDSLPSQPMSLYGNKRKMLCGGCLREPYLCAETAP